MGLGHDPEKFSPDCNGGENSFLLWIETGGSVKTIAVAGRLRGIKKPEFSKDVENIERIFPPSIPSIRAATSARIEGIWNINDVKLFSLK